MARLKSGDKRNLILSAAIGVFAERGLGAPALAIAVEAGVAEGTLFTYFKTKDELVNALYCEIKLEMANAMMSGFPRRSSVRHRLQHVWERYVDWGVANQPSFIVRKQIELWSGLTVESRAAGAAPFVEIQTMVKEAIAQRIIRDLPQPFIGAIFNDLAETTMRFMQNDWESAGLYKTAGFEMAWAGIIRK